MKKSLVLAAGAMLLSAGAANAGEYVPYVGFDYVNMTPNVVDVYPDNYDIGAITGGVKLLEKGSLEIFAERSMREKKHIGDATSRGRFYGYGADVLINGWNFSEGAILGSIGYGRISGKLKNDGQSKKDTGNTLRLGMGGELNPTPDWGLRAMFRYSLSDSDVYKNSKEFTLGARYYFY
ncbi:MAG: outer membrane beta-barrel protein [Alphaproteobacteria bacterium]|jgi:opacity protein-like surface antigen|nr:outer membrane beta-barrel protein [Alphaproteobacteria bacterium]